MCRKMHFSAIVKAARDKVKVPSCQNIPSPATVLPDPKLHVNYQITVQIFHRLHFCCAAGGLLI